MSYRMAVLILTFAAATAHVIYVAARAGRSRDPWPRSPVRAPDPAHGELPAPDAPHERWLPGGDGADIEQYYFWLGLD